MVSPWVSVDHPQLGEVEVGGIDYMRTIRNPPEALLPAEVGRGAVVADRMLSATPKLSVTLKAEARDGVTIIDAVVENLGYLPTAASVHARQLELVPPIRLDLSHDEGVTIIDGDLTQTLDHLEGWGSLQVSSARHAVYPGLGASSTRARVRWVVQGSGPVSVKWTAVRAGSGSVSVVL